MQRGDRVVINNTCHLPERRGRTGTVRRLDCPVDRDGNTWVQGASVDFGEKHGDGTPYTSYCPIEWLDRLTEEPS